MPELPEVENIKLQLSKFLVGHKIEKVEIRYDKCFEGNKKHIEGDRIKKVRRFGKVLVIDLNNGYSLVIHIKLTGQLIYRGPNLFSLPPLSEKVFGGLGGKHTHVIFHLDRGGRIFYNDFRKFGWIKVVKTKGVGDVPFIRKLGPEPFKDLTLEYFAETLRSTRRAVKVVLMDQAKIGGVGNIYANDALWLSCIHPARPANGLTGKEVGKLYKAILEVLRKGIEKGGASELSFVHPDGTEGNYQKHFLVYGKEGQTCTRCKSAKIEKIKLSGRGTYFCPACQSVDDKRQQ